MANVALAGQWEQEAAGLIVSAVRHQRDARGQLAFPLLQFNLSPQPWDGAACTRGVFYPPS